MIEFNELLIRSLDDYDILFERINKEAIDDQVVHTLKTFFGPMSRFSTG